MFLSSILFLLMINLAFSIEITLAKDNYYPHETFQAEITGHFISLKPENIFIYKNEVPRPSPIISDLTEQESKFYFYAQLPKEEGNYSLKIKNAEYTVEGELKTDDLVKSFTIKKSNQSLSVLSINPGFVVATEDFSIKIKSPFKNQEITTNFEAIGETKNLSLIEDEEKTLQFSIAGAGSGKTNLKIGNYNIPVFIIKYTPPPERKELNFIPSEIKAIVTPGTDYFFKLILENSGEKNLTNIKFSNNLNAVIYPDLIALLPKGERKVINITIPISQKAKNNISGQIKAEFENTFQTLGVLFQITKNQSKVNLTGTTVTPDLSCTKIGKKCVYPEKCTGQATESLEGPCCLGECIEKKETDYSWIFGVILLLLLIVIVFFLYRKARQKQKPKSTEEILKEKSEKFNERMNPSEEVRGKLDRI